MPPSDEDDEEEDEDVDDDELDESDDPDEVLLELDDDELPDEDELLDRLEDLELSDDELELLEELDDELDELEELDELLDELGSRLEDRVLWLRDSPRPLSFPLSPFFLAFLDPFLDTRGRNAVATYPPGNILETFSIPFGAEISWLGLGLNSVVSPRSIASLSSLALISRKLFRLSFLDFFSLGSRSFFSDLRAFFSALLAFLAALRLASLSLEVLRDLLRRRLSPLYL